MTEEKDTKTLPVTCPHCNVEQMVDVENAQQTRPVEGQPLVTEYGRICNSCGEWEHLFYTNSALSKRMAKLEKNPTLKFFTSTLKMHEDFQASVKRRLKRHGASRHRNLAKSG